MKENLVDTPVQSHVVWGHICGKNRPIRLNFWLKWPKTSRFSNFYRKQKPRSVGRQAKTTVWENRRFSLSLFKSHATWSLKCAANWTTYDMTTLVNLAQTISISELLSQSKLSRRCLSATKSQGAIDLSLFVQDVQKPYKSKLTWGNKLRKKGQKSWRKDEFRSVFKNLLQKNTEELSDHYRNFDCKTTESFRSACPNIRHFGALHAERNDL